MEAYLRDFIWIFSFLGGITAIHIALKLRRQKKIDEQLARNERTIISFDQAVRKLHLFKWTSGVFFILSFVCTVVIFATIGHALKTVYSTEYLVGVLVWMFLFLVSAMVFGVAELHVKSLEKNPVLFVRCNSCGHDTRFIIHRVDVGKTRSVPYRILLFILRGNRMYNANILINRAWYIGCSQCELKRT